MNRVALRQGLILAGSLLLCLLPIAGVVGYVAHKHQWAQGRLAELEPRYARLMGLEAQKTDIDTTLQRANAMRTQYIYSADTDANQTGNMAQQRVRDIFSTAGLQIVSSQVLPAKEEKGFDRIPLSVRTEGEWLAIQSALAVLSSQTPVIVINELDIQLPGGLVNVVNTRVAPRLAATFSLSVLRERS